MITWQVIGDKCQGPAVLNGSVVGEHISRQQFCIDWELPKSQAHPDWPVAISRVGYVDCTSGATGLDKYMLIDQGSIAFTRNTVMFSGSLFSFNRTITLRAAVNAQMYCKEVDTWYPLNPADTFICKNLELVVNAGLEIQNPPWSPAEGVELRDAFRGVRCQTKVNEPITLRVGSAEWEEPLDAGDLHSVSIQNLDEDAVCNHPHATEDLKPTVSYKMLEDCTGIVIYPANCRPYTRYIIKVDRGATQIIHLRTIP